MMTHLHNGSFKLAAGALAGLSGTAVMMALRSFDGRYAPKTIPQSRRDPGAYFVKQTERVTGLTRAVPKPVETVAATMLRIGYGTLAGVLYAKLRGGRRPASALVDGELIGGALYAAGYGGWLPLMRLTPPVWRQRFPQIVGEAVRHVAYGITVAAVYRTLGGWQEQGADE